MWMVIRAIEWLTRMFGYLGAWFIAPLVISMVYEVISRKFFAAPTFWAYEVSYMLMGTCFMFGIAYTLQMRRHIRVDFFYDSVSLKQALGMRPLWHILAAFALLVFVVMTVTTHIMPYLSSVAVDRAQAGVVATLLAVLSIIGRLALGWVTDRWPYQRAMMVALLVMVVGLVCFIMVALDPVYLIPFLVIFPIGFGGAMVLRPPFVLEYFGQARFGTIFGLTMSASLLGGIAGPPLAGYIYDTSGNYFWFWVISIGALLLAVVAILTCPRPPKPAPRVNPV